MNRRQLINTWLEGFNKKALRFIKKIPPRPRIRIKRGLKDLGGYCSDIQGIVLNSDLTLKHLKESLGHEYAHWLDYHTSGKMWHGKTWIKWMRRLGLPPDQEKQWKELFILKEGRMFHCSKCHLNYCSKENLATKKFRHAKCGGTWLPGPYNWRRWFNY